MSQPIKFYDGSKAREPRAGEYVDAAVMPGQRAGRWYLQGANTTLTTVADRAYAVPILIHRRRAPAQIGVRVSNAGAVGAVLRLGIYTDADGTPGSLVVDAGTTSAEVATYATISMGSTILDAGMYWLIVVSQGAPATQPSLRASSVANPLVGIKSLGNVSDAGYYMNGSWTGALPAVWGVSSLFDSASAPSVGLML